MLRIDPPVDARYLHTTYLLDLAVAAGVRVVNDPAGVRALHEKLVALALPDLCPATVVGACPLLIEDFVREHGRRCSSRSTGSPAPTCGWSRAVRPAGALVESATRGRSPPRDRPGVPARGRRRQQAAVPARRRDRRRRPAPAVRRGLPDRGAGRRGRPGRADDRRIVAALAPMLVAHGIAVAGAGRHRRPPHRGQRHLPGRHAQDRRPARHRPERRDGAPTAAASPTVTRRSSPS